MEALTCPHCGRSIETDDLALIALVGQARRLRQALEGLIGASDKGELMAMEATMRALPAPAADKAAALNGIHALLDSLGGE
jgi:hypothetical protein